MVLPRKGTIFTVGFGIHTRSAGTSKQAKHQVSAKDIVWADLIAVMEYKHKKALQEKFSKQLQHKTVIVLDIPDDYYMDEELIEIIKLSMSTHLT